MNRFIKYIPKCRIIENYGVNDRNPIYIPNGASNLMIDPTTDMKCIEYWERVLNRKKWDYALVEIKLYNDNTLYFSLMCPKILDVDDLTQEVL